MTPTRSKSKFLIRMTKLIGSVVAILFSLLVFPNGLPWLLLAGVVFGALGIRTKERHRWLYSFCILVVLVKLPEWGWGLSVLVAALSVSIWLSGRSQAWARWIPVAAWVIYFGWFWFGMHPSTMILCDLAKPVVCVGDSLTDYGYPQELEKLMDLEVVDLGFNGYTTVDGMELLPEILASSPSVVVLELGGHDYKDGQPRFRTKANLETMIEAIQEAGAAVILVEIPRGFVTDPYCGLERQLARKYDLELIPDTMIRRLIYWSPVIAPGAWVDSALRNSNDGLHPNERGNQMMARYIADSVRRVVKK